MTHTHSTFENAALQFRQRPAVPGHVGPQQPETPCGGVAGGPKRWWFMVIFMGFYGIWCWFHGISWDFMGFDADFMGFDADFCLISVSKWVSSPGSPQLISDWVELRMSSYGVNKATGMSQVAAEMVVSWWFSWISWTCHAILGHFMGC